MTIKRESRTREANAGFLQPGSCLGQIVAGSTAEQLLVDFPGNGCGPLVARSVLVLDARDLEYAVATAQSVLLMFEQGDPQRPIVVGLIQPSSAAASEMRSLLVAKKPRRGPSREPHVDGEHLVLEGYERVTLKCGEASITLHKNGKLQLKGAYIESDSTGVNRIKGGTVKIN